MTGPRPTGLGNAVRLLWNAAQADLGGMENIPLRPDEQDRGLSSVPSRVAWEQLRLPAAAAARGAGSQRGDLLFSPALGTPLCPPCPLIANVNDLIPLHYRQQFRGIAGWYWKTLLPACWRHARIITVSNASLVAEVSEGLGYPAQQIRIVPYYPNPALAEAAARIREQGAGQEERRRPVFVTLGSHEPRKNLELAIQATARLRSRGVEAELVCIGAHNAYSRRLEALAATLDLGAAVHFPGYLSLADTAKQLLSATALLSPSFCEGFGLPPLEAMSIGCPAIVSDIPCHRAVYGRPAGASAEGGDPPGTFVDPRNPSALTDAMHRMAEEPVWRARCIERGLALAGSLTMQKCAEALQAAFAAALT